jgi:hypothetical protein
MGPVNPFVGALITMADPTVQTQIADFQKLVGDGAITFNAALSQYRANNKLLSSGLVITSPEVAVLMGGGSQIQTLGYINRVDTTKFNHSSDDYDQKGKTGKIGTSNYQALRMDLNWGWAYTDLFKIVTKYNPEGILANALPYFWGDVSENIMVSSLKGSLAADASLTAVTAATTNFSIDMLIDAESDMNSETGGIIVSRRTLARMKKDNKNAYVAASDQKIHFSTYNDYKVIVSDAFGDDTTVVVAPESLAFGAGATPNLVPTEIERDANAGNGGGGNIFHTRLSVAAHPQGMSYDGAPKPELTDLANGANWKLAVDRKLIGFRAIKHKAS